MKTETAESRRIVAIQTEATLLANGLLLAGHIAKAGDYQRAALLLAEAVELITQALDALDALE